MLQPFQLEFRDRAAEVGVVVPANFNAPGQLVVSGERAAVARLGELADQAGAKRVIELAVSGAFHSPLLAEAAVAFSSFLDDIPLAEPEVPVVANVTALSLALTNLRTLIPAVVLIIGLLSTLVGLAICLWLTAQANADNWRTVGILLAVVGILTGREIHEPTRRPR